jgi:uncharacterized protein involved in exopolysaccharide biosynthesis
VESPEQSIDVRDLIWRVQRYGWLVVLPVVACLCGAAVYYKLGKPVYESQVVVAIDESKMSPALEPLVRADRTSGNPRERLSIVDSKIHNHVFLSILAERLGMNNDPERLLKVSRIAQLKGVTPEEYAMRLSIGHLASKIDVSPGRASFIRIRVSDTDPEAARKVAEMIGDLLIEESRYTTLASVGARQQFSTDQIAVYEARLAAGEDSLRLFQESRIRRGYDSLGVVSDENLNSARSLHRTSEGEMQQIRARIQTARNEWQATMGNRPIPEFTSPSVADRTRELGELETGAAMAQLRGGPESHAEGEAMQARIAAGRQDLFGELEQLAEGLPDVSPSARAVAVAIALDSAVLRSLAERRDRLASVIETYMSRAESSPRDEMQLQRLKDNVQTSRELLVTLRKEATSSQISEALATSELGPPLDIMERPLLPLAPVWPQPLKVFGLAGVLGVFISAGIVFAGERLVAVVRTLEQAEAECGVRVLGTIPRIEGWSKPGTYIQNHWAALAILLVLLLTGIVFAVDATRSAHLPTTSQALGTRQ